MFYKKINGVLIGANEVLNSSYYLWSGNKIEIDGWKWFDSEVEAMALTKYITPSNPTGLVSESFTMFGLGSQVYITPMTTGNIKFHIKFIPAGVGAYNINQYKICYGNGNAPVNGAAATGTVIGGIDKGGAVEDIPYTPTPIVRDMVVTGLSLGVQYWFDIQAAKYPNNSIVGISSIEIVLEEYQN